MILFFIRLRNFTTIGALLLKTEVYKMVSRFSRSDLINRNSTLTVSLYIKNRLVGNGDVTFTLVPISAMQRFKMIVANVTFVWMFVAMNWSFMTIQCILSIWTVFTLTALMVLWMFWCSILQTDSSSHQCHFHVWFIFNIFFVKFGVENIVEILRTIRMSHVIVP